MSDKPLPFDSGTRAITDPRDPRASELLRPWDGQESLGGEWALLGAPYDGGIPSRPGARFGPRALREALASFGSWEGGRELPSVVDLGDLSLPTMNGAVAHRRVEQAAQTLFGSGANPLFLGGDHGLTGSILRGLAAARPELRLALITIDAHLDVREYADDASLSSGTPFRRALETPVLEGPRVAMIGIRRFANSRYYLDWAGDQGIHLFLSDEVAERGAAEVAKQAVEAVLHDAEALYLSMDLDAADAAAAPGVSAPGVGGLTSREMITLVGAVGRRAPLIGADLMELSPPYDQDARTAKLGARLLLELLRPAPPE